MEESTTMLSMLSTDTVMLMTETKKAVGIPIDDVGMSLSQRKGRIVFVSTASMRAHNTCARLHDLLRVTLRELSDDQSLYWGSDLDYGNTPLLPEKLYDAASLKQLGQIKVTDRLLPMAEFLSSVDSYAAEKILRLPTSSMSLVMPKTANYAKRYRDTHYPWMFIARRLTDFRMFYGEHQNPEDAISRMRTKVDKLLDYLQNSEFWVGQRKDMAPLLRLDGVRLRNWYTQKSIIAALALAVYGRVDSKVNDSIMRQDRSTFRECAGRVMRLILSDWAAKYYGPEYIDREALDGAKTSDKRIYFRDPPGIRGSVQ